MNKNLLVILVHGLLLYSAYGQASQLDIMVPELLDTELSGPVHSVYSRKNLHTVSTDASMQDPADLQDSILQEQDGLDPSLKENEHDPFSVIKNSLEGKSSTKEASAITFDYTFEDIADKLVIISCKSAAGSSAGSGFVAKMNGKTYLLTNQHVILGVDSMTFRTADGEMLPPLQVDLSMSRDIARILINDRDGFKLGGTIEPGTEVGVFGNSEGAGVATELFGTVTRLDSDIAEITAEFVSGNSGSPVLNSNQEVIGIASYVKVYRNVPSEDVVGLNGRKITGNEGAETTTRRFCYRLTDMEWKSVKWRTYNNQYGELYQNCRNLSAAVYNIINIWAEAPFHTIPYHDNMEYDLVQWIKQHNDTLGSFNGQRSSNGFRNAYADSLELLAQTCTRRARRALMFSTQRELTGFLKEEFERHADALTYAADYFHDLADKIIN